MTPVALIHLSPQWRGSPDPEPVDMPEIWGLELINFEGLTGLPDDLASLIPERILNSSNVRLELAERSRREE